jgi:hypothetical protein
MKRQCIKGSNKGMFYVEYFLLGITPASELSESTFRNLVSVPSSWTISVGLLRLQSWKMELTPGSETSTHLIQTPGVYPKENTLHQQHGESLKTKKECSICSPSPSASTLSCIDLDSLIFSLLLYHIKTKTKLRGLSSRANYTDRAAAAGRRS